MCYTVCCVSLALNNKVCPKYRIQNKEVYTTMSTVILSARVEEEEARKIDQLAAELGLDRGALLRQMIRRGLREIVSQTALDAYRRGEVTLSRAAEIAGISLRDMLLRLSEESLELNYDLAELERDIGP